MNIAKRATSIEQHHKNVADLETRAKKTNQRREEAERKNNALQSLRSKLEDLQIDYETLRKWQSLGDVMNVGYNKDDVDDLKRDIEADLRIIINTDFEGFEDAQEIRDIEEDFGTHNQKLNERQLIVQNNIEEYCEELFEELSTKLTVLRIPDVGSEEDETLIEEFQDFLRDQKRGDLHQNPATRYEELKEEYEDIEISFETVQEEYNIGDEAMEELKRLLNNERVTLANIDESVLNDLKNLSEFSQLLTIQFTEDK